VKKGHLLPEGGYARCADCGYWNGPPFPGFGECRRHAPTLRYDSASGRELATFPQTPDYGWCGDFARNVERERGPAHDHDDRP
jgi:hypothetical protein